MRLFHPARRLGACKPPSVRHRVILAPIKNKQRLAHRLKCQANVARLTNETHVFFLLLLLLFPPFFSLLTHILSYHCFWLWLQRPSLFFIVPAIIHVNMRILVWSDRWPCVVLKLWLPKRNRWQKEEEEEDEEKNNQIDDKDWND